MNAPTVTGTPTAGTCISLIAFNTLCIGSDSVTPSGTLSADPFLFADTMATGYSGGRNLIHSYLDIEGVPSGTGQGGMVAGTFTTKVNANLGGLSDCSSVLGDCNGSVFGVNPNLIVTGNGTYLNVVVADNVNVSLQLGASAAEKHAIYVSATNNDAVPGIYDDSAVELGAQDPNVIDNFTSSWSAGATSITTSSDTGVPVANMSLSCTGIAAGTTITGVTGTGPYTLTLSLPTASLQSSRSCNASYFVGWKYGINFAPYVHHLAFNVNSTLIGAQGRQAGDSSFSPVAKYGVDWSNFVFTSGGCAFRSPGHCIGPNGELQLNGQNESAAYWGLNGLGMSGTGATFTDTTSTGTSNEALYAFPASTLAASNAFSPNNLADVYIPNPTAGTNVTPSNTWALMTGTSGIDSLGPIKSTGLLSGALGETITGGAINLNVAGTNNVNIATGAGSSPVHIVDGTGSGTITIGNSTHTGNTVLAGISTGTNADFLCLSSGGVVLLQTSACTISSLRFKEHVEDMQGSAVPEIAKMEVASYNLKDTSNRDPNATTRQTGLIAENIAQVAPECAIYEDDMKTPKSYRQECVIALLVKATQEQAREISRLKHRMHR